MTFDSVALGGDASAFVTTDWHVPTKAYVDS